jgi:hypothetical protein
MKKIVIILFMTIFVGSSSSPSPPRTIYSPVFLSREALENSVKYIPGARDMIQTGKIYYMAPYIYVNERYKGVHIINNSNPTNPINEGFILSPGCIDMAVKGNILYLDNAVDLVGFDLQRKVVTKRIRNVLPEPLPPEDFSFHGFSRPHGYVLVEWKKSLTHN